MKTLLILLLTAFFVTPIKAQDHIITSTTSNIHFFSKAPLENIEAVNKEAQCAINLSSGKLYAKVPIKGFQFRKKLMQKHFNENYMESEKYPTGELEGFFSPKVNLDDSAEQDLTFTGSLTIHGKSQEVTIPLTVKVEDGQLNCSSTFHVALKDHNIKVPKIMLRNIAKSIKVDVWFQFKTEQP